MLALAREAGLVVILHNDIDTIKGAPGRYSRSGGSAQSYGAMVNAASLASWGFEDRDACIRIPESDPRNLRIEHRVAGADANPYLVMASVLAGIHHGLTNQVEPGEPVEGNAYEQTEASLPNNLRDALRELDDNEVMGRYIDPKYIDVFVACKESELAEFEYSISDLEYNWYLHTV